VAISFALTVCGKNANFQEIGAPNLENAAIFATQSSSTEKFKKK
jgi:hypothetical protein